MLVAVLGLLPGLPAAAAEIPVRGLVHDVLGHAVAGARVELLPVPEAVEEDRLQLQGKPLPGPVARATVGADGECRLAAPDAGLWVVRIEAPGFVPAEVPLVPLIGTTELEPVTLPADVGVRVRVSDSEGRPLAAAQVWAAERGSRRWPLSAWRWRTADAMGIVTLPRGAETELSLSAYAPVAVRLLPDQPAADLQAAAGCPRRIEVRDGAGRPVQRAYVVSDNLSPSLDWVLGVTGEDGGLTVVAAYRQRMRLAVEVAGGRRAQGVLEPETGGKPPLPLRLSLPPAVHWTGRVVTADRGEPLAGAWVWCAAEPGGAVRTGADGRYSLAVPWGRSEPSTYAIQAAAAGSGKLLSQEVRVPGTAQAEVAGPNFAVVPDAWLAGTVTDASGVPVPGAEVFVRPAYSGTSEPWRSSWRGDRESVLSDDGGRFRLQVRPKETGRRPALMASLGYHLLAVRQGFVPATLAVEGLEPGAGRPALRLVLRRGRTAAGRIVDPESGPVAGAEAILVPARESPGRPFFPEDRDLSLPAAVRSDAEGRFALPGVRPGTFDLQVRAPGLAPAARFGIAIPDGEGTTDLGVVRLDSGLTVEGQVVDPEGRPVEGATVGLWDPIYFTMEPEGDLPPPEQSVRTGRDGRFLFTRLPRYAVAVRAERSGYGGDTLERVALPAPELLRLVMQPVFSVSGRVVNDQGEPVASAGLTLLQAEEGSAKPRPLQGLFSQPDGTVTGPDGHPVADALVRVLNEHAAGRSLSSRTDAAGRFQSPGLRTGSHTIEVLHRQYAPARREVTVQPGANWLDVRLQLTGQ
ncbi:MAG: carboxypeptidase-like regulatory domain-containing protein [Thermoanaerobaculia bacterium]